MSKNCLLEVDLLVDWESNIFVFGTYIFHNLVSQIYLGCLYEYVCVGQLEQWHGQGTGEGGRGEGVGVRGGERGALNLCGAADSELMF